jgi:hypothetical protein
MPCLGIGAGCGWRGAGKSVVVEGDALDHRVDRAAGFEAEGFDRAPGQPRERCLARASRRISTIGPSIRPISATVPGSTNPQNALAPSVPRRLRAGGRPQRALAEHSVRPIIFDGRGGTCRQPYIKVRTITVNSIFNGWRMEDVWLDK